MRVVFNCIRCIQRNRRGISTIKNWVRWHAWIRMWWNVLVGVWWHNWMRVWWHVCRIIIRNMMLWKISSYTSCYSFLGEPWVDNIYSTIVIWRKLAGLRPMSTFLVNINIKPPKYNKITCIMGGRGYVMRNISSSPITINTFYGVVKGIVDDILRPNSTSSIITPTTTYYIVTKTIIRTTRIYRCTQQSTMSTFVMWGRDAGMGTIYTYTITTRSFLHILRERMAGVFRPIYTSYTIITSITPLVTIITTSISLPITIITTDITHIGAMTNISYSIINMQILVNRTRRNWWTQKYTMDTWVMGGRVAGPRTISTSPININYCSKIEGGRVDGILRPSSTSTTNTKMINSMISRERVDGILRPISPYIFVATIINSVIARLRVYGLKINIPKS